MIFLGTYSLVSSGRTILLIRRANMPNSFAMLKCRMPSQRVSKENRNGC